MEIVKRERELRAAAEAEAAAGLKGWTVAALCRSMSLENILLMLSGRAAGHT